MLTDVIPTPYKVLIGVVIALLVFGAGWMGGMDHMQPKLDNATTERAQWQASFKSLKADTDDQNAAVQALADNATKREAQAAEAIKAAKAEAKGKQGQAQRILQAQPPAGTDMCAAARAAFDAELAKERGAQ